MQKIGPSKADNRALRDHLAIQLDSPPLTPKSVRPPLSPIVEAELRAACAYVLHNFKPSHVVYDEQYGGGKQKAQLDYAAIKESVHKDVEELAPLPLSKINTRTPDQPSPGARLEEKGSTSPDRYRYKPDVPTEELFVPTNNEHATRRRSAMFRADQLMSASPPKASPPTTRERSGSHLRSVSNPLASLTAPKSDILDRPRTVPRTHSVETTGSTPQTDNTDYPWSDDKASTAMTSAAITPARSKRTSSQALQSGSEHSSAPKVEPVSADRMRQELDKHKKAQEERLQQEKAQEEADATDSGVETTPKQVTQTPTPNQMKVPARKPVPTSRSASKPGTEPPRLDKRQSSGISGEMLRSKSVLAREAPRSASRHDPLPTRSDSRSARLRERSLSRARSVTRQVKEYVRPPTSRRTAMPEEPSRPRSRAGSVARQVKEYIRPGTATGSRKPSMDMARPESRARSTDSYRSATSDVAPSVESSMSKWKTWRPYHRRNASHGAADNSRPGTSGSTTDSRGRTASRDAQQSPEQKSKPAINLNRDLPPLPSLDSWKDEQLEKPKHVTSLASPPNEKRESVRTPRSHRPHRSKQETKPLLLQPEIGEKDEIVAARMGSPSPPKSGAHSHKASVDISATPPCPTALPPPPPPPSAAPPSVPPPVAATMRGPNDFDYGYFDQYYLGPTTSIEPSSTSTDMKKNKRRSQSIQVAYPSDYHEKAKNAALASLGPEKSPTVGQAQRVTYTRANSGPINTGLRRTMSKASGHLAKSTYHTPVGHSRNNSGSYELSRELSMDDHHSYQRTVEISAQKQQAVPTMPKDKKWWQRMGKKPSSPSWMDQVVKSGARGGVLVPDDVAGAPVVRY